MKTMATIVDLISNFFGTLGLFLTFLGSIFLIWSGKYKPNLNDNDVKSMGAIKIKLPSKREKKRSKELYNCGLWFLFFGFLFQFIERIAPLFIR